MLTKERLERLNTLAKKAKMETLTEDEKVEQHKLRQEYLGQFRDNFRKRLENIVFVDEEGNEIDKTIQ